MMTLDSIGAAGLEMIFELTKKQSEDLNSEAVGLWLDFRHW
jgi:hypothetical protein